MRKRLTRIAFLFNALLFLKGGLDAYEANDHMFAGIQILATILNILFLSTALGERTTERLTFAMHIINIGVASYTAYLMFVAEKTYLPFAWIIVAIFSVYLLFRQLRKSS